jgi:hypothetical protein
MLFGKIVIKTTNLVRDNDDVSNRTRSKADYTDKHVGTRTRSRIHNVNNVTVPKLFLTLNDKNLFQEHGKFQEKYLLFGILEKKGLS